jgi:hypothetical protein
LTNPCSLQQHDHNCHLLATSHKGASIKKSLKLSLEQQQPPCF